MKTKAQDRMLAYTAARPAQDRQLKPRWVRWRWNEELGRLERHQWSLVRPGPSWHPEGSLEEQLQKEQAGQQPLL